MQYEYYINLDERGEFYADLRTPKGKTIAEIRTDDLEYLYDIRVDARSALHIEQFYKNAGIIKATDSVIKAN